MFFFFFFFFSSRRRHTRCSRDWSSDVCSSDLAAHHVIARGEQLQRGVQGGEPRGEGKTVAAAFERRDVPLQDFTRGVARARVLIALVSAQALLDVGRRLIDGDRKSTRLNSSHGYISYAVFCL